MHFWALENAYGNPYGDTASPAGADAFETTIWAAEFQSWPTSGSDSLANGPEQQQSVTEGI